MLKIGLIGYGYWGPNLLRNFRAHEGCRVVMVSDQRPERLKLAAHNYPDLRVTTDADELLTSPDLDAIAIATPVYTHFNLAKKALLNGKHVLIEKPMTSNVAEALELMELAEKKGLLLMVDHTFLYTGAVKKMKQIIDDGTIGEIHYFDSSRINLGLFQPDVNVLWDLAPHDISILLHLVGKKPHSLNATGISHTRNGIENIAYLTLNFTSDLIAHFSCSWTSPVKLRTLLIGGDKKMMVFNDLEPTEKIRLYDTGYSYKTDEEKNRLMVDYRVGDVYIPKVEGGEALAGTVSDFVNGIVKKTTPLSSAALGLEVIRILEASQTSIKEKGREVVL